MQNFNTNQTRHFYVAGADKTAGSISDNLDIQVKQTATGEIYFLYKNADGLLTRSDTIDVKKVVSVKKTAASAMARPLMAHVISVDTNAVTLSSLVGKTINVIITIKQLFDYDEANSVTVTASVVGNSTNTATAAALHKDIALAIAKVLPKSANGYPFVKVYSSGTEVTAKTAASDVTGSANGVVLVEGLQKYVRGKLSGEPCPFDVAFRLHDGNLDDVVWGKDEVKTVAAVNTAHTTSISPVEMPGNYVLADLEYFALGERGDMYRGFNFPNNYETTYVINPFSGNYDVLTIEFYWNGEAENVQKSPRMIQVTGAVTGSGSDEVNPVATLYATVMSFINGSASGSGSGA